MLQYLVILLDDTSAAYCHADNPLKEHNLMPIETLKKGILFGMKQNLMIQYVFPDCGTRDYELPKEYAEVIESIDNVKIYPTGCKPVTGIEDGNETDVEVANEVPEKVEAKNLVLRLPFGKMLKQKDEIAKLFASGVRINLCITDVEQFTDGQIEAYKQLLEEWNGVLLGLYKQGLSPQFNLLTDRMMLKEMHNCEAGVSNITLAPNGKFYLCPAFYYDERMQVFNQLNHHQPSSDHSVGDLEKGLNIPNPQLLRLDHAPLCRNCDAYQCRRCLWLNRKLTWDINTPSHQQCVMAHIERNASRALLNDIRKVGEFMPEIDIKEINYLDPFEVRKEF
ncbi:MAG: Radical SAM additional 4Fe4S-binding domain-containing protein [bacterium F082]|nr:MAG: Radical SAM additional 4Fe4S-binding domain-containing protein [bacterium F082]KWW30694.1 MAG: Radical SAM additional 4Fe4S-binding domain-containing protein [bacterium P201]